MASKQGLITRKCKWEIASDEPLTINATMRATIKIVSGYDGWKDRAEAEQVIVQIQSQVEAKSMERMRDTLAQAQAEGTDTFHLGRWLYAWHPNLVQEQDWPTQFAALPINLQMDTSIEIQ